MANKVAILSLEKKFKKFEREIEKTSLKILEILKKKNISVEIYLAGNQEMRFLNKKFRDKDKPTNVLSFEEPKGFIYPKFKFKPIGEVYLNINMAAMQKMRIYSNFVKIENSRHPHLFVSSYIYLLTHGLLHLFSYDHKNKNDRIKMEKKERLIIKKLGN